MTNGEKYKTIAERLDAFTAFCNGKPCAECELLCKLRNGGVVKCAFDWLELECKPVVNACPSCGNIHADTIKVYLDSNDVYPKEFFYVSCPRCHMRGPEMESKEMAIEQWNKLRRAE